MKKFKSGQRFKFDARSLAAGGTKEKVLILDGHDIEKYRCRFDIEGIDLTEFERTGGQGFFGHNTEEPPICDWKLWKEQGALWGVPTFHSDMNPKAAIVEKLWAADKINAVSVGIEVLETIDNREDEYTTISKSSPYEVSIVNFGAHPHAGKGLSMMLSAAVGEGIITDDEADSIDTEGATLRKELETLRADNARLQAELTARPKPQGVRVLASQPTNHGGIAVNPEHLSAAVQAAAAKNIAAVVDRVMRLMTGKLPD